MTAKPQAGLATLAPPGASRRKPPSFSAPPVPGADLRTRFLRSFATVAQGSSRVPEIDGLRGVAILLVLVWHASLRAARYLESIGIQTTWYSYFPHGELGVCLFFFISGFVLASPLTPPPLAPPPLARPLTPEPPTNRRDLDNFSMRALYARRFMRIYPPYAISLLACFALIIASGYSAHGGGLSPVSSLLASLAYIHALVFDQPSVLNPPVWSLEVEAQFYLLAPFLMLGYFRIQDRRRRLALGLAACIASLFWLLLIDVGQPVETRFALGLANHAYLFLGGIVAADLASCHAPPSPDRRSALMDALFMLGVLAYAIIGLWLTKVDAKPLGGTQMALVATLLLAATSLLFAGALYGRASGWLLRQSWLRYPGILCFSIYLCHVPVLQIFAALILPRLGLNSGGGHPVGPAYLATILGGGSLVALVSASFFLAIERPSMQWRPKRNAQARPSV